MASSAVLTELEPGKYGFPVAFKSRYSNYIGGEWVAPLSGEYFENVSPVTGKVFCEVGAVRRGGCGARA